MKKSYGKYNAVCFIDEGFDRVVSQHRTKVAAAKAAKRIRNARFTNEGSFRVVTGKTIASAFGLA